MNSFRQNEQVLYGGMKFKCLKSFDALTEYRYLTSLDPGKLESDPPVLVDEVDN